MQNVYPAFMVSGGVATRCKVELPMQSGIGGLGGSVCQLHEPKRHPRGNGSPVHSNSGVTPVGSHALQDETSMSETVT
jgi:hypothetical protein